MMVPDLQVKPSSTSIEFSWDPPQYAPDYYEISCTCTYAHKEQRVSSYVQTREPSMKITKLLPGSVCEVLFRAIYNPATLDPGVKVTVTLTSDGKDSFL